MVPARNSIYLASKIDTINSHPNLIKDILEAIIPYYQPALWQTITIPALPPQFRKPHLLTSGFIPTYIMQLQH